MKMELALIIGVTVVLGAIIAFFVFGKKSGADEPVVEEPEPEFDGPLPELTGAAKKIPHLSVRAGPRDGDKWNDRVKQELNALVKYAQINQASDSSWFNIAPLKGTKFTKWEGKCWYIQDLVKYEFDVEFEIPVTYPKTPFEIVIKELDGKTVKMYRGGKICLSAHFKPLWGKNVPHFGIAHALALGLAPWLAAEVPHLVDAGIINDTKKGGS